MNEIFAVDPDAPKSVSDLALIAKNFGFSEGRFIANFPEDWRFFVGRNFSKIEGPNRLRVIELINKCNEGCLPISRDYQYFRGKSWLTNAIDNQKKLRLFKLILSNENVENISKEFSNALVELSLQEDSREIHMPATIENYMEVMRPLMMVSSEIYLRDFNFYINEPKTGIVNYRQVDFLKAFFKNLASTKRCEKIMFILDGREYKDVLSQTKILDRFIDIRNSVGASAVAVDIKFGTIRKKEHGRYLFSLKGGLHFDSGFDTPKDAVNHVSWMTKAGLMPLLEMYGI